MLVEARDAHGEPGAKLQWSTSPVRELSPFCLDYHSIIGKHYTFECQRLLRQVASAGPNQEGNLPSEVARDQGLDELAAELEKYEKSANKRSSK